MDWVSYNNGQEWRVNELGIEVRGEGILRTRGEPITAHTILEDFDGDIAEACEMFDVDTALVVGLIWKESLPGKGLHRQIVNKRYEPGYVSDMKTPNKVSFGLMQTLLSTAQSMNDKYELFFDIDGKVDRLDRYDLIVPRKSIFLGVAYLHHLEEKNKTDDPVLLQAAYNAGGVYKSSRNRWRLRTYGENRTEKFIAYYNDAIVAMNRRLGDFNV